MENEIKSEQRVNPENKTWTVDSVREQGSGIMNEDQVLQTDSVCGVFDGATSLVPYKAENGDTGGFLASSLVSEYFRTHTEGTLFERACAANALLKQKMESRSIDTTQRENLWGTGASVVEVHEDRLEWFQVNDCSLLFIYEDGSYIQASPFEDHDTEVLSKWKTLGDKTPKEKSAELREDMVALRRQQNVTYGVMNGDPEAEKFFRVGSVPREGIKYVLGFTDGGLIPKENPGEEENFDECVKVFLAGGLPALKTFVREREDSDPDCVKYPRYKTHDDMGAFAITLETA